VRRFLLFLLLVCLPLLTTGCTPDQRPALGDARQAICQSLVALRERTIQLTTISPDTTVNELRTLRSNLNALIEAARAANVVMQTQPITDMVDAYGNFSRMLDGLNPDQYAGDAATALLGSANTVVQSLDQAYSSLSCAQ